MTGQASPVDTYTLWRGDARGEIYAQASGMMTRAWKGRVQPDGSVLFTGSNPLSTSFQASLGADGAFEIREAVTADGKAARLSALSPEDRYIKAGSQPVQAQPSRTAGKPAAGDSAPEKPVAAAKSTPADKEADGRRRLIEALQIEAQQRGKLLEQQNAASKHYWSYCTYTIMGADARISHYFVSKLINQRVWIDPGPWGAKEGHAEYKAYVGPNTREKVEKRFKSALDASGLLPDHQLGGTNCHSFSSYEKARSHYDEAREDSLVAPVDVRWNSLADERLAK